MASKNYLIGRGELLVEPIPAPPRNVDKIHPYSFSEARERLAPQLAMTIAAFATDATFAPNDVHVARFSLHPAYLAKSYHPTAMLRTLGLEVVGSRVRPLYVDKHIEGKPTDVQYSSSELFVAGTRGGFAYLLTLLEGPESDAESLGQIRELERIDPFLAQDKVKPGSLNAVPDEYELVLHRPSGSLSPDNQAAFIKAAERLGIDVYPEKAFEAGTLWFLPAQGSDRQMKELAEYATVRIVRPMPRLTVEPILRQVPSAQGVAPTPGRHGVGPRVAILDGGLPSGHSLMPWIESYIESNPEAAPVPAFTDHGLAVTSAFLFGSLPPSGAPQSTPSRVSVFRVLDDSVGQDHHLELYSVLAHIEEVLMSRAFELVNISLGPDLPIEDDDVHAWTSVIDDRLDDGETLVTVAAGNNGALDRLSNNARVQVPGDAVNVLTVGAADRAGSAWARANYSALGPGRFPGRVKPDLVAFGGCDSEPFLVYGRDFDTRRAVQGTSFASPLVLRQAALIRGTMGDEVSTLASRALLIHAADASASHRNEVGWGRLPSSMDDIITSGDGVARIIYQGEVRPGKYLRAPIPIPAGGLQGRVNIRATFCYATAIDAGSPDVYTRAALEPVFRPNLSRFAPGARTPQSKSFFPAPQYDGEDVLRFGFGKWEPVLRSEVGFNGTTLVSPVFDIHYNARQEGAASSSSKPMQYALVVTIEAGRHVNLHDQILNSYPNILRAIEPSIEVEIDSA
jgi:hypothetical protein